MTVIQYLEEILALSLANSVKLDQVMRSQYHVEQDVLAQTLTIQQLTDQVKKLNSGVMVAIGAIDEVLQILETQFTTLVITYFDSNGIIIPKEQGMPVTITDIQSVSATVTQVDAAGNPVPLESGSTVVWSVGDATILTLTQNPDNSASFKAAGPLGSSTVSVSVTPPSGTALTASDTVTVVASAPVGIGIQFGTPA